MKRRLLRGMTLVEGIVATALTVVITLIAIEAGLGASQSIARVSTTSKIAGDGRNAFQKILMCARTANGLLTRYPSTGKAAFAANKDRTLILRNPVFNAQGEPIPNRFQVDIFVLETATGDQSPNAIRHYQAQVDNGTESATANRGIIATRVNRLTYRAVANEVFFGNRTTLTFRLVTRPVTADSLAPEQVLVGGTNRLLDGWATRSGDKVTFKLAPENQVPIDVTYQVDPTVSSSTDRVNVANVLALQIVYSPRAKNRSYRELGADLKLESRVMLMNR